MQHEVFHSSVVTIALKCTVSSYGHETDRQTDRQTDGRTDRSFTQCLLVPMVRRGHNDSIGVESQARSHVFCFGGTGNEVGRH